MPTTACSGYTTTSPYKEILYKLISNIKYLIYQAKRHAFHVKWIIKHILNYTQLQSTLRDYGFFLLTHCICAHNEI